MIFEVCYLLFIILILAVFGAAAGAIGTALLGWPPLVGTLSLIACISFVTTYGTTSVERLFKWVSIFLYAVYAIFVVLSFFAFGDRILVNLAAPAPHEGWVLGRIHLCRLQRGRRGDHSARAAAFDEQQERASSPACLAGPFAMIPALLFFICMIAYYPQIGSEALPSDFLLQRLNFPAFHYLFQLMIFLALLESGTGCVHAFNERIAEAYAARKGGSLSKSARLWITGALLLGSIFLAARFGLVTLIARGYRGLAYMFLAVFVLPVMTFGVWQLFARSKAKSAAAASP